MYRRSKENCVYRRCSRRPPDDSPDSYELKRGKTWGLSLPLDIMVGSLSARRPSKVVRPRVCSKPLPNGSFVDAGGGLYVSSPEFFFFQMALEYPLAKLIELGLELCGSYSMPSIDFADKGQGDSEQALYNLPRLTSKKRLKAFAARMKEWPGHRLASKALQYITNDSASPMETILVILLTLPYRNGGYGLPMPELNGRIVPEKKAKRFLGRSFYRGDLLWRKAGVVAEYNSDLEHTGPERIAMDAIRRSDLDLCGISEVTVTKSQIKNEELFENVAKQLAAKIGKELRYKDPEFSKARNELRRDLLRKI